jgi:hypothetical protein
VEYNRNLPFASTIMGMMSDPKDPETISLVGLETTLCSSIRGGIQAAWPVGYLYLQDK